MESMSLLPKIKCSSCAVDIDIAQLADHVCAVTAPTADEPLSPTLDRAATFDGVQTNSKQDGPGRARPPVTIDPYAASMYSCSEFGRVGCSYSTDKPFLMPGSPLTPSPLSPIGQKPFQRSATSPLPRPSGPASPAFSGDMDTQSSMQLPSTTYSGNPYAYGENYTQPSPLYAPLSPRTDGGENVLKKMNTIAPGPFDGRSYERRPSTSGGPRSPTTFSHRRTDTQNSLRGPFNPRASSGSTMSQGSTFSYGNAGLPSRTKPGMMGTVPPPPPPPPVPPIEIEEKSEGIDAFLERLQKETMGASRSNQANRSQSPMRQNDRSRSPMRPETRSRSPMRQDPMEPVERESRPEGPRALSRRPPDIRTSDSPPRLTSAKYAGPNHKPTLSMSSNKELPPLPVEQVYTPSDSGRSEDSYASSGFRSVASSRSSPPQSEGGHSRQASKTNRFDNTEEPVQRTLSPDTYMDPKMGSPLFSDNRRANDNYNMSRGPEPLLKPPTLPYMPTAPESPVDPAIQKGLAYGKYNQDLRSPRDPALNYASDRPRIPKPFAQGYTQRQPSGASKGKCRGCGEPILGKSVKDSSGRLSGRYHKECFVCHTCRDPFPTAEFYVFENSPYCHQHYHTLNGSLCRTCNRGIEGQYLETDQRLKFHPRCFTCFTCRIVLRDDYYELGRRNFCERHAYAAMNQRNNMRGGPNGQNPNFNQQNLQKRRTRMMMMR
ncbi:hypothetical protein DM02DRAFT_524891 [Periconia macrospinosa]|uniref:LIM zinc-binding domain-containing protein n=1 Tax=Periconia macrospinosa TaxID=97972 RepID=A0A2V1DU42_9PLEO|nr:hypothetical protein DM02DRAFT_524891 [Periconia macrospinosa]